MSLPSDRVASRWAEAAEALPHDSCPACGGLDIRLFFQQRGVPVHCNVLWPTSEEARRAPRGDILLGFCRACGMIYNYAFDPPQVTYQEEYENSLHFSPKFREYARWLAEHLSERFDLRGKAVVEIGSGKGEFLALLVETAGARGIGFDPSYEAGGGASHPDVRFVRDLYSERYASDAADLVFSRHVLEHVDRPGDLLATIRRSMGERPTAGLFLEVPNALFILREQAIWDVIYEHCSYFTPGSLSRLVSGSGFEVVASYATFHDQFLCVEARPTTNGTPSRMIGGDDVRARDLLPLIEAFADDHRTRVAEWEDRIREWMWRDRRVALWGAGSKGVTFLNTVAGGDAIGAVVDVNPRKTNRYVPGTGHRILSPEELRRYRPHVVIVANPVYLGEVEGTLQGLGIGAAKTVSL